MSDSSPRSSRLRNAVALVSCAVLVAGAADAVPAGSGTFTLGATSYKFTDAVAFQTTRLNSAPGELMTVIVLTADPIDGQRVAAAVKADGNWTGSGHVVRLILRFDAKGKLAFGMFQADAKNIGMTKLETVAAEVSLAADRATGRATLAQPADFLGQAYTFAVSFQTPVVAR